MSAIIFDLDGTLLDSAPDIAASLNAALDRHGAAPLSLQTVRTFIGRGAPVLVERARIARRLPDDVQDTLLADFLKLYERAVALTQPYPGAIGALDRLVRAGHRLGLCTNKPIGPTRHVLSHFDLAHRMDAVVGGDSLKTRKPDPAPLFETMRLMAVRECVFVGDSETDCETADAAGMPFVLFTEGYRTTPATDLIHAARFDDWALLPDLIADAALR